MSPWVNLCDLCFQAPEDRWYEAEKVWLVRKDGFTLGNRGLSDIWGWGCLSLFLWRPLLLLAGFPRSRSQSSKKGSSEEPLRLGWGALALLGGNNSPFTLGSGSTRSVFKDL